MKPLIIANWKCNPTTQKDAKNLFELVKKGIKNIKKAEVVICPPFIYLPLLGNLSLGGQDCFWEEKGPYTGEVSPEMLKNLGCEYVIIGHSERRKNFSETDEMVNKKLKKSLSAELSPIFCIGETSEERKNKKTESVLKREITEGLRGIAQEEVLKITIAYEPVWAISKGDPYQTKEIPTPENIKKISFYIKSLLSEIYNKKTAENIRIIYGGSANSENARGFIKEAGMQGLLVGGASLIAEEFVKLVKSVI